MALQFLPTGNASSIAELSAGIMTGQKGGHMSDADRDHFSHGEHSLEPIRYPLHHVVAVLDSAQQTQDAVDALISGGFLETEIGIGTGSELADRVRETTGRSGFAAMAMRFNDALGLPNEEAEAKSRYEQAMREGRYVVAVLAPTPERKEQALTILSSHGAHNVGYFGRFVIEKLAPGTAGGRIER